MSVDFITTSRERLCGASFGTTRSQVRILSPRLRKGPENKGDSQGPSLFDPLPAYVPESKRDSIKRTGHGPFADPRPCQKCGSPFQPTIRELSRPNRGKYCSVECANSMRGQTSAAGFMTPPSTKTERIRANGLVNMRIRRGGLTRPEHCVSCGRKARLDMQHPDYSRPDLVAFLCRSCHQFAHRRPEFEKSIADKLKRVAVGGVA